MYRQIGRPRNGGPTTKLAPHSPFVGYGLSYAAAEAHNGAGDQMDALFKVCPSCRHEWPRREDFLADPAVTLVGYQVHWEELELGLLYFNHSCGTTMAIEVANFSDLYHGPIFRQRANGMANCPGHCLRQENLKPCPAQCECAYVRAVITQIREWPKRG